MEQKYLMTVLFFLKMFIQSTSGYYNLQFQFHHYTNPGGRVEGGCCDYWCFISTSCDTHFKICLRNGGTSHNNNGGCLSGTSLNPGDVGGNDIKFGSTIGNINNPFSYSGSTISQSGYQLYLNVYDYDSGWLNDNDLIDKIFVEVPSTLTSVQSQKITGIHNRASLVLSYTLSCAQNYYGTDCSVYCIPHDDNQNGHYTCDSTTGNIVCLSGWQNPGNNCKDVACELVCGEGGNCTNSTCVCNDGWTGDHCDTPQCAVGCHPEGGYCDEPNVCMCHKNWEGTNCSQSLCAPNCSSVGGNCSIPGQCICLPGYTGDNCSIDMLPCEHQMPCENSANCTNINGSNGQYICTCSAGYTGSHCEDDINECLTEPCYNNSTCINLHDDFKCLCLSGWTGNTCEEDIDECAPNPCLNNGTCMDLFNGHYCVCTIEFEGLNCELEVNTCIPDPCENNATCVNLFTNYTCLCPTGYTGNNCEFSFSSTVSSSIVPTVKPELSTSIPIPAITGGVIGLIFIIVIFILIIVLVMWFAKQKQNHHKIKDNGEMDYENSSVDVLKMEHLMYEVPDDLVKPIYANKIKEKATPSHYDETTLRTVPNELYSSIDKGTPPNTDYSKLNFNQYETVNMGMGLSSDPVYNQLEREEQHTFSSDTDNLIANPLYGGTLEREEQHTSNMDTEELIPNPLYGGTLEREEQPTSNMDTEKLIPNPLYGGTLEREEQPTSNMDTEKLIPNPLYGGTLEREEQPTSNMDTEKLIPNPLYGETPEREEQPTSNMDTEELIPNPLYGGTLEREEQPTSNMDTEKLISNPLYGETPEREEQPTSGLDTEELVPNPLYSGTLEREEESKFHSSESEHMLLSNEKVVPPTLNYDYVEHRQTSAPNTLTYDYVKS